MRNTLMRAVGVLAVLVLPAIGSAATGPYMWTQSIPSIPNNGPGVEALNFTSLQQHEVTIGCAGNNCVDGGFDFNFFGETFGKMRIGTKGYVTFGASDSATANPTALHQAAGPSRLIAAWWGNHFCDPQAGVKHQVIGNAPEREHRVEWTCTAPTSSGQSTGTEFRARIALFENSSVIQLSYGALKTESNFDWSTVRVGIKSASGSSVQHSNALPMCDSGNCTRAHFPEGKVIQYGTWVHDAIHPNAPDLFSRVGNVQGSMDLSSGQPVVRVSITGELRNLTDIGITDFTWRAYISPVMASYSNGDPLIYESTGVDLDALGDLPISFTDVAINQPGEPHLTGKFYACIGAVSLKPEKNKDNNWNCNPEPIILGPDLVGTVVVPKEVYDNHVQAMIKFPLQIRIRNLGNLPAFASTEEGEAITYEIWAINAEDPKLEDEIILLDPEATRWSGNPQYGPAQVFEGKITEPIFAGQEITQTILTKFPFTSNNGATRFIIGLKVGTAWNFANVRYNDSDPSNNVSMSDPTKPFEYLAPGYNLTPGSFHFEMPLGCTMDERAWGSYEICNLDGTTAAKGFLPVITFTQGGGQGALVPEAGLSASLFPECKEVTREQVTVRPGQVEWRIIERDDPNGCDPGSVCSFTTCWPTCDRHSSLENHGCDEGFACVPNYYNLEAYGVEMDSCLPFLEVKACHTYEFDGVVPSHEHEPNDNVEDPTAPWYIPFEDLRGMMPTAAPNSLGSPAIADMEMPWNDDGEVIECYHPKAELIADALPMMPLEVVAGEQFVVERAIRNSGTLPSEFEYSYHISLVPEVSRFQPMVPVVATKDGVGLSSVERMVLNGDLSTTIGNNRRHDTLVMPSQTPPGLYYFGFVVDPRNQIDEITKANNIYVHNRQIRVREPSVRIETERLPFGTVGVRYNYSLWASGGTGAYRWEKGKDFPSWLELDPATGHLSGIPTEARDYHFQVTVRSGNVSAKRTFLLRVLAPEGMLHIPPHVLPLAIKGQPYGPVELKANGGKPPYQWQIKSIDEADPLPVGFCFTDGVLSTCPIGTDGVLGEVPRHLPAGSRSFYVGVQDARGAKAWTELRLQIAGDSELHIFTAALSTGMVGSLYHAELEARGGSSTGYTWTVENLPRGLEVRNDAGKAAIEGTPLEWGVFMVQANVFDPSGLTASKSFALEIANVDLSLTRNHLGEFERGDAVDERLDVSGLSMTETVSIRLLQGRLPSGLELTSDHWVRGVISSAAEPGTYSVVLELRSDTGRLTPAALSIRVKAPPPPAVEVKEPGCGASATGNSPSGAVPLALALLGLIGWTRSSRREALDSE